MGGVVCCGKVSTSEGTPGNLITTPQANMGRASRSRQRRLGRSSPWVTGLVWAHPELIGMRTSADTSTSIHPRLGVVIQSEHRQLQSPRRWGPRNKGGSNLEQGMGWETRIRFPVLPPSLIICPVTWGSCYFPQASFSSSVKWK